MTAATYRPPSVPLQDRAYDCVAALLLGVGVLLFGVGRHALGSIADGSYAAPTGASWVAVADQHTLQTTWGLWLVGAGVLVAIISAGRHAARRRTASR
ncbi:MAG: hypothetical protein ABIZ91_07230 [Gemmatimonadaceae bacterium]